MNEQNLPRHILDKMERRWASRIARAAAAWQGGKQRSVNGSAFSASARTAAAGCLRNSSFMS
jgi:hypothetical protein